MDSISNNDSAEQLREENKKLRNEIDDVRFQNQYLETLVKETYHRTKNHLSVLMSALNFQSRFYPSEVSDALSEARMMVMSIVTLNELLSQSRAQEHVSTRRYLSELGEKIFALCCKAQTGLHLELDIDDIELDPAVLLPCGMVINELIINAFKHAFPQDGAGTITVFLCCKGESRVRLGVRDNGKGASSPSQESMGIELVKVICRQLDGEFEISHYNGMECSVSFVP